MLHMVLLQIESGT